ncbi:HK97 family phage prohead protease [Salmonella enterica]|nr:HK97 family phage prohead protease [Salmonella enterica]
MQTKQRLDVPLSLKSVSDSGEFEGYGSVFGVKDSHDDVVMSGAFAASLRAWSDRKALPALLWQHRMDEPIGVYTEMKEDDVGLYVKGRLLIDDDPLAKRAHAHMKAGSLTVRQRPHIFAAIEIPPTLSGPNGRCSTPH